MMRRQAICLITPDAPPQPMFRELYISIDELRAIVMPGYNIASDRWLFQRLTQTLDLRMLQLLMKNDDRAIASAFSVNLNVATLLSDRFLAFDASLKAATRGTVVFELQTIDIFSDLAAYIFARDFVKERGYRICLDGVTDLTLPFIDRERLGLDLIKIVWNPDMLAQRPRRAARRVPQADRQLRPRPHDHVPLRQRGGGDDGPVARHRPLPGPPYRSPARRRHAERRQHPEAARRRRQHPPLSAGAPVRVPGGRPPG